MSKPVRYRKKPVVIEAMLYDGSEASRDAIYAWGDTHGQPMFSGRYGERNKIGVETLEGAVMCSPGDYMIRGIEGEFYPCKPSVFAATYEVASDD